MAKKHELVSLNNGFTRNQARTSPALTEARTKMTALQLKVFYQVVTLIQMDDTDFKEYEIDIMKFAESLALPSTNRDFLKDTCLNLSKQSFYKDYDNKNFEVITIFSSFKYKHKEQKIIIKFNDEIKPYLLNLKQYTKIQQVKYITSFESKYAIRIYALLKDYRKMTYRDFKMEALSKIFELPKSYKDYAQIYNKVLHPAIKEINEKSDLFVNEPEIIGKKGKKITNIRLKFGNKSEKMSIDFVSELTKRYKRQRSFNVFLNCYYLLTPELVNPNTELVRIKRIDTQRNNYFQAFTTHANGDEVCFLGTPNKDDFLNYLANGIYKAVSALYEIEKQETLPLFQWQEQKDREKRLKAMIADWQENPEKAFFGWK